MLYESYGRGQRGGPTCPVERSRLFLLRLKKISKTATTQEIENVEMQGHFPYTLGFMVTTVAVWRPKWTFFKEPLHR